jgi:hypothetical protein
MKFVQINLHDSKASTATFCQQLAEGIAEVAFIQEPCIYRGQITGLTNSGRTVYPVAPENNAPVSSMSGTILKDLITGSWIVLSLYKPGALKMLSELHRYKLDITAIQELRWMGKGVMEKKDHVVFYSCQKSRMFGTGFIVSKKKKLILGFQAKSHTTCRLRIKGKFFNYSLICALSPTEDKSDEEKDSFYDELDEIHCGMSMHFETTTITRLD